MQPRDLARGASRPSLVGLLALLVCSGGCGGPRGAAPSAARPAPVPEVGGLRWTAPQRWIERPADGMKAATYEVRDDAGGRPAECSIFYFGQGTPRTMSANLDRWRAQFSRVDHEGRAEQEVGDLRLTAVEIAGSHAPTSSPAEELDDALLLGAAIDGPQGPVYVKCVGPGAALGAARPEFAALIGSFSLR